MSTDAFKNKLKFGGTFIPLADSDTYPTHSSEFGYGGWREIETKSALADISWERIAVGMAVYVISEHSVYICTGKAATSSASPNATWEKLETEQSHTAFKVLVNKSKIPAGSYEYNGMYVAVDVLYTTYKMTFTAATGAMTVTLPRLKWLDSYGVKIKWGDEAANAEISVTETTKDAIFNGTHTYTEAGTYAIEITRANTGSSGFLVVYPTAVDIEAGDTHKFTAWVISGNGINVSWGDGTSDTVAKNESGDADGVHQYASEGIYTVKVYGDIARIKTNSSYNLIHKVLDAGLPLAAHHNSLQNFAIKAKRLFAVDMPSWGKAPQIENLLNTFNGCANLRMVSGFKRFPHLVSCSGAFKDCYALMQCDFKLPPVTLLQPITSSGASGSDAYRCAFYSSANKAWNLAIDIASVFPDAGFAADTVDLTQLFYNYRPAVYYPKATLSAAGLDKLARVLWKSGKKFHYRSTAAKTMTGKETALYGIFRCFSDEVRAQIPEYWGGTLLNTELPIDIETGSVATELGAGISTEDCRVFVNGTAQESTTRPNMYEIKVGSEDASILVERAAAAATTRVCITLPKATPDNITLGYKELGSSSDAVNLCGNTTYWGGAGPDFSRAGNYVLDIKAGTGCIVCDNSYDQYDGTFGIIQYNDVDEVVKKGWKLTEGVATIEKAGLDSETDHITCATGALLTGYGIKFIELGCGLYIAGNMDDACSISDALCSVDLLGRICVEDATIAMRFMAYPNKCALTICGGVNKLYIEQFNPTIDMSDSIIFNGGTTTIYTEQNNNTLENVKILGGTVVCAKDTGYTSKIKSATGNGAAVSKLVAPTAVIQGGTFTSMSVVRNSTTEQLTGITLINSVYAGGGNTQNNVVAINSTVSTNFALQGGTFTAGSTLKLLSSIAASGNGVVTGILRTITMDPGSTLEISAGTINKSGGGYKRLEPVVGNTNSPNSRLILNGTPENPVTVIIEKQTPKTATSYGTAGANKVSYTIEVTDSRVYVTDDRLVGESDTGECYLLEPSPVV